LDAGECHFGFHISLSCDAEEFEKPPAENRIPKTAAAANRAIPLVEFKRRLLRSLD
jgi:hypothetical protein